MEISAYIINFRLLSIPGCSINQNLLNAGSKLAAVPESRCLRLIVAIIPLLVLSHVSAAIVYSREEHSMKQLTKKQKWWGWLIALCLSGSGAIVLTICVVRWTISAVSLNP